MNCEDMDLNEFWFILKAIFKVRKVQFGRIWIYPG